MTLAERIEEIRARIAATDEPSLSAGEADWFLDACALLRAYDRTVAQCGALARLADERGACGMCGARDDIARACKACDAQIDSVVRGSVTSEVATVCIAYIEREADGTAPAGYMPEERRGMMKAADIIRETLGLASNEPAKAPPPADDEDPGAERWGIRTVARAETGERRLVLATRRCCGPDGVGPCLAAAEGLACGTAMHPVFEPLPVAGVERGRELRTLRRSLELALGDAARALEIRVSTLSMLESGRAITDRWQAIEGVLRAASMAREED